MGIKNILLGVLFVIILIPSVSAQIPGLPHNFYGDVLINNQPAPDGTLVSAEITGKTVSTNIQNPVETVSGNYGKDGLALLVQGSDLAGSTVEFYVNGVNVTGVSHTFSYGGGPTEVDLSIPAQANGKICSVNAHCSSNRCVSGVCTAASSGGGGSSSGGSSTVTTTSTTTTTIQQTSSALVIIDTIRTYYSGSTNLTPFDILDLIKGYYGG